MNVRKLRFYGVLGGMLLLFLGTFYFIKTYKDGSPKWNYVFMVFGMALILFYTIFKLPSRPQKKRKM